MNRQSWMFLDKTYFYSRITCAALAAVLLLALFSLRASAQEAVHRTFALVDFPPFAMREGREIRGVIPDFIKELDQRTGTTSSLVLVPVNRVRHHLIAGEADFSVLPRGALAKGLDRPLLKIGRVDYLVWPRKGLAIRQFADMQGLVYSALRNGHFAALFDSEPLMEYAVVDDFSAAIRLLKGDRIDAVTGSATALVYWVEKERLSAADIGRPFSLESRDILVYLSPEKSRETMHSMLMPVLAEMANERRFEYYQRKSVAGSEWQSLVARDQGD